MQHWKTTQQQQRRLQQGSQASFGLPPFVDSALKFGGFLYALGFVVILVHTSSLHVPVVEALRFQNILAGWPIGLAMWLAFISSPLLKRAIQSARQYRIGLLIVVASLLVAVPIVRAELLPFAKGLSVSDNIVLFSGILFVACFVMLITAHVQKSQAPIPIMEAMSVYSLVIFCALGYALFVYPRLPQSIGGGRPEPVQLYYKSADLHPLLGGLVLPNAQVVASDPVYLYHRTSDCLLVSKSNDSDHQLVQVPLSAVDAIVWLQSSSPPR